MGTFANRLITVPKISTALGIDLLPVANGAHGRSVTGPEVKIGSEAEGVGTPRPSPLLPCPRGQACWSSCRLPRVLRLAKMP